MINKQRIEKANQLYGELKENGYLFDKSVDSEVKLFCSNISGYEISEEEFDFALRYVKDRFENMKETFISEASYAMRNAIGIADGFRLHHHTERKETLEKYIKGYDFLNGLNGIVENVKKKAGKINVSRERKALSLGLEDNTFVKSAGEKSANKAGENK